MSTDKIQSSFRDPSGNIFTKAGEIYRQVNFTYKEDYDFLMDCGLYQDLTKSGLLIEHEEIELNNRENPDVYKILKPQPISFISYPYEWCFSQLKDAGLTTLAIQKKALEFGMTLKDSSAFNIQFIRGKPILIDTLSFQKLQEGQPWIAYKQFCQHFLAPLALMNYKHVGAGLFSRNYIDGVPLELVSALLPIRSQLKLSMQIHLHLHARLQKRAGAKSEVKTRANKKFTFRAFQGLIDNLESTVKHCKWRPKSTVWTEYYDGDSYTPEGLKHKTDTISEFLTEAAPKTVWDLGGNTGLFSRIASDKGIETISFDQDPGAIELSYATSVQRKETTLLPLVLDLTNPSPRIGWANRERMDLTERGPVDMLLALALIHHLAIANSVPLGMIAEYFSSLCTWAVVEFVPKSDKQTIRLLTSRDDTFPNYSEEEFEKEFSSFFKIQAKRRIENSERTLYLMRGL